jgi:hypothetical protein
MSQNETYSRSKSKNTSEGCFVSCLSTSVISILSVVFIL